MRPRFGQSDQVCHSSRRVRLALDDNDRGAATASALSAAVTEFGGPDGSQIAVTCFDTALVVDDGGCSTTAAAVNAMVEAFTAGGFQGCVATTPTTSPTSTSVTTSPTTTTT
jgi:hypothetical protein